MTERTRNVHFLLLALIINGTYIAGYFITKVQNDAVQLIVSMVVLIFISFMLARTVVKSVEQDTLKGE